MQKNQDIVKDKQEKSKNQLKKEKRQQQYLKKQQEKKIQQQKRQALAKEKQAKQPKEGKIKKKEGGNLSQEYLQEFQRQKLKVIKQPVLPGQGNNILITSALPYVNNVPHLGNLIGCVLSADVYARYKRLVGDNVLYICGTDQYGTATEVKALEQGKTPKQVCDFYNKIHQEIYQWFDIDFDYFGRTSTEWHAKITQQIFLNIKKYDLVLQDTMNQCYCEKCDLFLADRFVTGTCPTCHYDGARGDQCDKCQRLFNNPTQLINSKCHVCKNQPIIKQTVHYFIDLAKIQPDLQKWINESSVKGEWTQNSNAVTKSWLTMGLKQKCITRDLKWGVPVPVEGFQKKVFYVWFDAPIGYISITANYLQQQYKKWWLSPNNVKLYQFMGKDNIPFHTVMFPSSLIASQQGWTLLHHISTTQYLNYEEGKFSKSRGTGVFGDSARDTGVPSQVWRYYLLINRPEKSDSKFSWTDFKQKNNNELLANLGNLCNRVLKFAYSAYKILPKISYKDLNENDLTFIKLIEEKFEKYNKLLQKVEIKEGLKTAMQISSIGNKYIQDSKPWQKVNQENGRSPIVIGLVLNFIRFVSVLIEPYMPTTSAKINFLLGTDVRTPRDSRLIGYLKSGNFGQTLLTLIENSSGLREPCPLFKTITELQQKQWRQKFKGKEQEVIVVTNPIVTNPIVTNPIVTETIKVTEEQKKL